MSSCSWGKIDFKARNTTQKYEVNVKQSLRKYFVIKQNSCEKIHQNHSNWKRSSQIHHFSLLLNDWLLTIAVGRNTTILTDMPPVESHQCVQCLYKFCLFRKQKPKKKKEFTKSVRYDEKHFWVDSSSKCHSTKKNDGKKRWPRRTLFNNEKRSFCMEKALLLFFLLFVHLNSRPMPANKNGLCKKGAHFSVLFVHCWTLM